MLLLDDIIFVENFLKSASAYATMLRNGGQKNKIRYFRGKNLNNVRRSIKYEKKRPRMVIVEQKFLQNVHWDSEKWRR